VKPKAARLSLTDINGGESRICIIAPYTPSLSETFIQAHVERLPARVVLIHGWPPRFAGRPILPWARRALQKAWQRLGTGEPPTTAAYLEAFQQYRPDAVLAEYGTMGVAVLPACKRMGIPLIVHFHGFDASLHRVLEENVQTYPDMFRVAASVIAVSRAMQRKLISLGAACGKVHYNPYGVDCVRFSDGRPTSTTPTFVAVGRFVEKKAPDLTLRAFAEVRRAVPHAELRMVGDGPLLRVCRQVARELGITAAVTFLGAQPQAVVQEEMRRARCFVQHSIESPSGDCEGTPVGILEAGATGLPVVSTRHAGIPDVVIDGETGFLVAERDVQGMAHYMLRLARDPELAQTLGEAARRRITAHFSIERSIAGLWKIISSSMDPRCMPEV